MGSFGTKFVLILSIIIFGIGSAFAQTTYYSVSSGNFSTTTVWNSARDGSGSSPTAFDQGDIFTIQNGDVITMDNVSNLIQDLIIESGGTFDNSTNTIVFAVGSHGLDVQSGGTYTASTGTIEANAGALNTVILKISANTNFYNITTSSPLTFDDGSTTSTFTIDGTLKFSTTRAFTLANSAAIAYGTNGVLEYNADRTVSAEWPVSGGVPYVSLTSGTTTISDGNTHQVNTKLTLSAGALAVTSGSLAYGAGASLEYIGTSQQAVGAEWTSTLAPTNVTINNSSGATPAVDMGSADLAALTGTLELQNGSIDYSAGSHILTVTNGTIKGTSSGSFGTVNSNTLKLDQGGTITSTGTPIFYDIDLTTSGTFTLQNNFEVQGTLTVSAGTATVLSAFTLATNGSIDVQGGTLDLNGIDIVEGSSSVLTVGASGTLKTGGTDITGYNSYSLSGTVEFNGSALETIPAAGTIGTIVVNNASGIQTSAGTLTVGTALTLTDGTITTTSANLLKLADGITVTRTDDTDFIIGPLQKVFGSDVSFTFPVGFSGTYRPAVYTYTGLSGTGIIQVEAVSGSPGGTAPTGISAIATSHYYTLQEISAPTAYTSYSIEITWTGSGFSQDRNQILVQNGTGPTYTYTTGQSHTTTTVTLSGLTGYPTDDHILAIGSSSSTIVWNGSAGDGLWSTAGNWDLNEQPQKGDAVEFSGSYSSTQNVEYDASTVATEFASIKVNPASGTVNLTLNKSALNLTATSNALVVTSGNRLIFGTTVTQMGGGAYDPTLTDYQSGSTVEYTSGSVFIDDYSALTINGATGTSGSGTGTVSGLLTKDGADFTTAETFTAGSYTNTAGTATFSGTSLSVAGTTTLNGGTLAGSVSAQGDVVFGGGTVSGTFTFAGGNAQDISGTGAAFSNMTINKSANDVTCSTAVSVSGTLTLTAGDIITTSTNKLTLGAAASYSGGGDASHVNGPLARMTDSDATSYEFPVGNGTLQRRVRISPTSSSAETYTVELVYGGNGAQDVSTSYGTGIDHVSHVYYWNISRSNAVDARVTLYWEDVSDGVASGHESEILVAQYDGSQWVDRGGLNNYVGDYTAGSVQSNAISTWANSQFALATSTPDNSLPVELMTFTAKPSYSNVKLEWKTASELNNQGFDVYRSPEGLDHWKKINDQLIAGQGNSSVQTDYEYVDSDVIAGRSYAYRLESVSINGVIEVLQTVNAAIPVPKAYALFNNYPNPFNPTTNIKFQLPEYQSVKLEIYNVTGGLVKTLLNNQGFEAGEHVVTWNATDQFGKRVSSGMYFYRFTAGRFSKLGKMVLLK